MLRYVPMNVPMAPVARLAQITPTPEPRPPKGIPPVLVNLAIMTGGIGIGLLGFSHRKSALGAIATAAGGSIAGVGFIFFALDLMGFRPAGL